jgi:hypothetical protein
MEIIDVTAEFDSQGRITPSQFLWKGTSYRIDSIGRRWEDDCGQHILVMIPGGRVFELLYTRNERVWYLIPIGSGQLMA